MYKLHLYTKTTLTAFLATLAFTLGISSYAYAGWFDKISSLWGQTVETTQNVYAENWSILPGNIRLCVAKELKGWINSNVIPRFATKAPRISIIVEAHGSGTLVDAMNAGNTMRCDILITGSDVAAMRWNGYNIRNRTSVAYSPTVWVGDKEKLDAARAYLKKAAGDRLTCNDLVEVSKKRRYSRIKAGGRGRLMVEMTTSNSGQSMYTSCVYSIADALDPQEVESKLNKEPAVEDKVRAFFKGITFRQNSTTTLTIKPRGQFMHPNGISYKHLAIATYESFLPQLDKEFTKQGKVMEVIYPRISILNNFPAVRITTTGKNGKATEAFIKYMMSEEAQRGLLRFGFRPANPKVNYSGEHIAKYFNNNIEVGDAPASQQMLRDMWGIVSDEPKAKAVRF